MGLCLRRGCCAVPYPCSFVARKKGLSLLFTSICSFILCIAHAALLAGIYTINSTFALKLSFSSARGGLDPNYVS